MPDLSFLLGKMKKSNGVKQQVSRVWNFCSKKKSLLPLAFLLSKINIPCFYTIWKYSLATNNRFLNEKITPILNMSSAAFRCEATDRNSRSSAYSKANLAWVVHFKSNFKFSLYTTALKKKKRRENSYMYLCFSIHHLGINHGSTFMLMCHCDRKTHKKVWLREVQVDSGTHNQRTLTKEYSIMLIFMGIACTPQK